MSLFEEITHLSHSCPSANALKPGSSKNQTQTSSSKPAYCTINAAILID